MPSSDQQQRSPDGVGQHPGKGSSLSLAAADRIRERYAYQEGEGWLDRVVQRTTEPLGVGLVPGENLPEETVVVVRGDPGELQHFAHHQQHDEAAIGVHRQIANGG